MKRYLTYSATFVNKEPNQLLGKIIAHYHVIEKGLSYQEVRLGFAKDIVISLISMLKIYSNKNFDVFNNQYLTAISVVRKYIDLHEQKEFDITPIKSMFERVKFSENSSKGGSIQLTKNEINKKSKLDFKEMAFSRYSIREFTEEEVTLNVLEEAIRIAQKSPSVCNRQTVRVHIVLSKSTIQKYLIYQNGNRGFGFKINKLLIVTSDLNFFEGVNERNQSFIDGGIFSMSLLYALHYLGLGAVTLNWCTDRERDNEFRKVSKISNNENIILMIGVGNLPDRFKVPKSERKNLNEIVNYIE
ncbi:hypothetical protein AUF42_00230 [Francisella hispaniensis FSC454]|nr:hypothetical protein AUF42_00230 [Francisella hispaniensis FSC454]